MYFKNLFKGNNFFRFIYLEISNLLNKRIYKLIY